ncbi:DUF317 domain-containing protein [Streptomyces sp. NBC_00690]|uniref:DUF317 domain-containing protein n=1 Tax=Streptomyces sp. NBC_00690 TaxID=2975808 RepID=UPI002E2C36FC|nr:DUF317 domain-containing protein [Streptomyces sp. NBC_00690]
MDDLDGDVYVAPRYLAGSIPTGDVGLQPPLDAGWQLTDDELGNVYLQAPDQRVRIGYLPEDDDDALWKIAAYQHQFARPQWAAAFSSDAPTELVAAFTTALVHSYQQNDDSFLRGGIGQYSDPQPVLAPLADADWAVTNERWPQEMTAPDGLAGAWHQRGSLDPDAELTSNATRWGLWGGPPRVGWYAVFSTHTPTAFITTTATALVDPEPVLRWSGALSLMTRAHAQITPVRPPAPTPRDLARIYQRKPPALHTVSVPRWSTTSTPSARLPGPARPAALRTHREFMCPFTQSSSSPKRSPTGWMARWWGTAST